jgi:hypothetical protein
MAIQWLVPAQLMAEAQMHDFSPKDKLNIRTPAVNRKA